MNFREKQWAFVNRINAMGDCFNQYAYLISQAAALAPMDAAAHIPENLVQGCQSRVWLEVSPEPDGTLSLSADSDTLIIKGILAIFADLIRGCSPEEISTDDWTFLSDTELTVTFSSSRLAGIGAVVCRIRELAFHFCSQ
ncbi:MAG: SufE family protein [Oscillospiraceae bacterium]|nr:SufE family protein [Oscillospiraceae bacterium]